MEQDEGDRDNDVVHSGRLSFLGLDMNLSTLFTTILNTLNGVSFYSSSFVFNLHMYSYQCVFVCVCVGVYREGKRYIKLEQILKWIGWIFFFAIFFLFFFLLVPTCVSFLSKSYIVTNVSFFWW